MTPDDRTLRRLSQNVKDAMREESIVLTVGLVLLALGCAAGVAAIVCCIPAI